MCLKGDEEVTVMRAKLRKRVQGLTSGRALWFMARPLTICSGEV